MDIYFTAHNPIQDHLSTQDLGLVNASLLSPPECARQGGHPHGPGCHTVPDIAFFSILFFVTSFLFAMALKHVKTSCFFPSMVSVTSLSVGENWLLASGPVCKWERGQKEGDGGLNLSVCWVARCARCWVTSSQSWPSCWAVASMPSWAYPRRSSRSPESSR